MCSSGRTLLDRQNQAPLFSKTAFKIAFSLYFLLLFLFRFLLLLLLCPWFFDISADNSIITSRLSSTTFFPPLSAAVWPDRGSLGSALQWKSGAMSGHSGFSCRQGCFHLAVCAKPTHFYPLFFFEFLIEGDETRKGKKENKKKKRRKKKRDRKNKVAEVSADPAGHHKCDHIWRLSTSYLCRSTPIWSQSGHSGYHCLLPEHTHIIHPSYSQKKTFFLPCFSVGLCGVAIMPWSAPFPPHAHMSPVVGKRYTAEERETSESKP